MLKAVLTRNSPFYIQFYVSKLCHLKCKMCSIVEANADVPHFPDDKAENIADNLAKIGAGVVLFTGGEPFLRPNIDNIVRVFQQKKLDVRLQTAGLMKHKDVIARCVEYGTRDINVSIDSLDEDLSDYLNGVRGSWRDAMEMIAYISQIFPCNDSICALGCVLSPYNLDEIEAVLDFATQIGWWLSLVPVHITQVGHPLHFRGFDEYFRFQPEQILKLKSLIGVLKGKKSKGYLLFDSNNYLDSTMEFVATGHPSWRHKGVCDSPNLYFAILPDGRFAPCCDHRFQEDLYVYDADFPKIYRSKRFRSRVREITEQCPGCNFGSYPEMTLAVRSLPALKERVFLQMRAKFVQRKRLTAEALLDIVEDVKSRHDIYKRTRIYNKRLEKIRPQRDVVSAR